MQDHRLALGQQGFKALTVICGHGRQRRDAQDQRTRQGERRSQDTD
jgi:hypothetical protein